MTEKNQHKAYPEKLPKETWSPLILSVGIAMIFWGIVSNYFISLTGITLFIYGLKAWINDLKTENNENE